VQNKADITVQFLDWLADTYKGKQITKDEFMRWLRVRVGADKRTVKSTIEFLNLFDLVDEKDKLITIKVKNVNRIRRISQG